jgi:NTE family protein
VSKKVAVILAGAVAKGAYAAGVLQVIAEQQLDVKRLVAASSGSLNAVLYASYVRRGKAREGVEELVELWADHAGFWDVFSFDLIALLRLEGVSSAAKVRRLLRSRIAAGPIPDPRPVSLRILVAPLAGVHSKRIDALAQAEDHDPLPPVENRTTYEYVCDFDQDDFDSEPKRDRVIEAALASSAFPFVFVPVEVEDPRMGKLGPCIDGGAVNNAPIKWAMGGALGDQLDAIIVVAPTPELGPCATEAGDLRGKRLINQAATMLINERLYRDLREAERVNAQLARLEALAPGTLTPEQLEKVKHALGWNVMKQIQVVQIRPPEELDGHAFSAFTSRTLRQRYIQIGRDCAQAAFEANRWLVSDEPPAAAPLRLVP